jgi:hypothetical protein
MELVGPSKVRARQHRGAPGGGRPGRRQRNPARWSIAAYTPTILPTGALVRMR